jgi:hypothetical protein
MMYKWLNFIAIAVGLVLPACHAQVVPDQLNPLSSASDGVHLYEVSVFAGYESSANPLSSGYLATPGVSQLGADENYGVSAAVGWQHHRDKTNFAIRYSGSYSGLVHYTSANGYSQWLNLNLNRKLGRKWAFNLTGSGQDATLIEVINEPSALSVVSQVPTDFNDFAAAFGLGSYSTAQAASMILGAPVVQAPLRALLLGNKVLSYAGNVGLTYEASRHLSFHVGGFAAGGESRSPTQDGVPGINYVLPDSIGGDVGANWTYALSPRTDVGASLDASRIENHFQDVYTGTATVSIGRKMGEHWLARIYGGGTYTDVTQQTTGTPVTRQAVGGGTLGVKTYSNTLAASYTRSASDAYGSVVGTFTTVSGTWTWHHPGSRISTSASIAQQQVSNTGFESLSGWSASAGVTEQLRRNAVLNEQYVYFKTDGNYLGNGSSFSVQSVRVTASWKPQVMQR